MDMKLEVVVIPVSDVDRAKRFYQGLGFRLDVDSGGDEYRVVHLTPPHSQASILFGKGVTPAKPGQGGTLLLAVDNIEEASRELRSRGADVSEPFHNADGSLSGFRASADGLAPGVDPKRRSYASYASFRDPDGNAWLLQELTERLPGRLWESPAEQATDPAALAELLREAAARHDTYDKSAPKHEWWDWYAPYIAARLKGRTPDQAADAADRHMEEVLHVVTR